MHNHPFRLAGGDRAAKLIDTPSQDYAALDTKKHLSIDTGQENASEMATAQTTAVHAKWQAPAPSSLVYSSKLNSALICTI
jgi:hypothetical protein